MFDIRALREQAGITQAALAQRLDITQVQVSRYEANPGSVPVGLIQDYLSALGVDMATALARAQSVHASPIPAPGYPYELLCQRIVAAADYLAGIQDKAEVDEELCLLNARARTQLAQSHPKPRVLLAGSFDAGKSHLANTLLGDRFLPSRYQPETRIPIYVRHVDDRPDFIQEDVWIMDRGFDPALWVDEEHARAHKRLGGNFLTLDAWASHSGDKVTQPAGAALVFVDAPLLTACELLDTPGSTHNAYDDRLSDDVAAGAKLVVYCSSTKGFLTGADMLRIRGLVQQWPQTDGDDGLATIERFFFVATHADPSISDDVVADILDRGAQRLARELSDSDRESSFDDAALLRGRLFAFWSEMQQRCRPLMDILHSTLSAQYPDYVTTRFDRYIADFKQAAGTLCDMRIDAYREIQSQLRSGATPSMPWPSTTAVDESKELDERIAALRDASLDKIASLYSQYKDTDALDAFIRREFPERKGASTYAAARRVADLQRAVIAELERDAQTLLPYLVERFGDGETPAPDWSIDTMTGRVSVPPNARGLVLGSLAGIAGLGPIAAWASTLGPWGGYLVVVQGVNSLGIGTAGTSAAISAVTAIGGPGVLAAGLVVITTVLGNRFMGRTWQSRLAQTITKHIENSDLLDQLKAAAERYWHDLGRLLEQDIGRAEQSRARLAASLAATLDNDNADEQLERLIRQLGEARTLLTHVPWSTST